MQKLFASPSARTAAAAPLLQLFAQVLTLADLTHPGPIFKRRFYRRAWCPLLTLWYLIWQRLSPQHTLANAVADARRGGADALARGVKPLSARLRSSATTAFAKARLRLPLVWVRQSFECLSQALAQLATVPQPDALPVRLLDGSTLRLRPHGDIPKHFPPHRTRRKRAYWCVARTVVCFCGHSAVALTAQLGSMHASEQALAVRLVVVRTTRRGWRAQTLFLFTTLTDVHAHPPSWLLAQYGQRWQVEVNLRWIKATLGRGQLEVKSAAMACKEFYAGLLAYNLVRGLMGVAARTAGGAARSLSFASARTILCGALGMLFLSWVPARRRWEELERVCVEVGRARLPRRTKARPAEPRAQYHVPQVFPPLRAMRAQARQHLKKTAGKS